MIKRLAFIFIFLVVTITLCQAQNPALWGMTEYGGSNNEGTIFSYGISTDTETDMHDFSDLIDGFLPRGSLIEASNGLLYGMTDGGGLNGFGTIFSYDISTGKETDIHDFGSGTDGQQPYGSLIQAINGLLYGMTVFGGTNSSGIIFSYDISSGTETDIHDFGIDADGQNPYGSLIQASNDLLYGMTNFGGTKKRGTIFSYDISTGTETNVHDFGSGTEGAFPQGSLIQANNDLLYGMTNGGGINGFGTIFSFEVSTGTETDIHDFGSGTDGQNPIGSLIQGSNGLLYGMTNRGGVNNLGTIFSYDTSTRVETVIHAFAGDMDGYSPAGSLILASNGLLYGMTYFGGSYNAGTIFGYTISNGTETKTHDFGNGIDGQYPSGNLIEVGATTGINQLFITSDNIQLYPNPSSTSIHFSLTLQKEQLINLTLYNTLGQQVWAEDLGRTKQGEAVIPVNNLANGVYILKVNSGNESHQKEVVVEK